jgi:hypothetical protein
MGFIDKTGTYYIGNRIGDDLEVVERPSPAHVWNGSEWIQGPPEVPKHVTMRQATQALILAGKIDAVNAAIAAIPGLQGALARAEWEKSQLVERNRPLVLAMGAQLGMSAADLDQLFITAAGL